jgi:molybdopterin biosynthesis enzyme MoaB
MIGVSGSLVAGDVKVAATSGGGHPVEFWAERLTAKIVSVSDTAPAPIRDQAKAYEAQLIHIIAHYMREAVKSDRTTLHHKLKAAGQESSAELILKL